MEYKKYDSEDKYECCGVRLAKDAEVRPGANGDMVTLTFVSTSRSEGDEDTWVSANINDRQVGAAAYLKKDDVLHKVEGKPCWRKWTNKDGVAKVSFNLRRASFVVPLSLFAALKTRGFTPGAAGSKPPAKSTGTRRQAMPDLDEDIPF